MFAPFDEARSNRRNRGVENLRNCRKVGAAKEGPPRRARNRLKNEFYVSKKEGIDSPAAHCFFLNAWRLGPRRILRPGRVEVARLCL